MRIAELRWTRYRIPFKRPLATAHGTFPFREGAIVEITEEHSGIMGIGEIAPPPGFGVTLEEALARLPELAASTRPSALLPSQGYMEGRWDSLPAATRFGLDTAGADCLMQSLQYAPTYGTRVRVNATIAADDVDEAVDRARKAVSQGIGCIKLKVGTLATVDEEVARVAAVRSAIGTDIHLRLDANEAWDFRRAHAVLKAVDAYDLQYCEQPLDRDNLNGMRRLRQEQPIRIAADEAVTDVASVQRIIDADAADLLVLKPQCIGAQADCVRLIQLLPKDIKWVWTSSLEAGIGVSATTSIAALVLSHLECGLATLDLLEDDLIVAPPPIVNGSIEVPMRWGMLDREALARYAV